MPDPEISTVHGFSKIDEIEQTRTLRLSPEAETRYIDSGKRVRSGPTKLKKPDSKRGCTLM